MKHRITFFAVLMMALAIPQSVMAYDFSAVAPNGQTLYYAVNGSNVSVVPQNSSNPYYTDAAKPTGDLVIPSSVTYGSTTYSVTSIGNRAFVDCRVLTSVTIPSSVTSIGDDAFFGCRGLTSVTIPSSVTSIGDWAFYYCNGLTSVTIPSGVTSIGVRAFFNCSGLTSVTIPEGVTSIGQEAFRDCVGLTSVTIPSSVTSIGDHAFGICSGLTSISVENGNTVYDSREGCNAIIETATNTLIAGCMNTVIPSGVTSIGDHAFYYCSGLTSVTIPEGVTSIGDYAFHKCRGLTSVTIPGSVTSIGGYAFYNCSGLTSIECLAMVPPTMGTDVFYNVHTYIPVYVPCGKLADYQAAYGWSSFDNIQELDGCIPVGPTNIAVYADGNDIVVEGAAGNTVTLYDNGGNTLSTSTAPTGTPLRFEGLSSGTYYVKIGVLPARMKVEVR